MTFRLRKRVGRTAKMGNEPTVIDGRSFSSKLEASVYALLKLRMKTGEIKEIQCQDHIYLSRARIGCIPDFKCTLEDGSFIWVEAKGYANDRWPIIKKLWRSYGPGPLFIYMGTYLRPTLTETIVPVVVPESSPTEENHGTEPVPSSSER